MWSNSGWEAKNGWYRPTSSNVLWTPSNLATAPVYWVDADVGLSVSGSNVTSWTNQGTGGNFTTVSSPPPTKATSSFPGGNSGVVFAAGGNYVFSPTGFPPLNPIFTLSVFKRDAVQNAAALWSSGYDVSTSTSGTILYVTITAGGTGYAAGDVLGLNHGWGTISLSGPIGTDTTSAHIIAAEMGSGVTPYLRWDGSAVTARSANAIASADASAPSFAIGQGGSSTEGLDGRVGLLIMLGYNPTSSDINKLEGWSAWRFGLQGSLPAGHAYKSRAPYVSDL